MIGGVLYRSKGDRRFYSLKPFILWGSVKFCVVVKFIIRSFHIPIR